MRFEFATAARVLFGSGRLRECGAEVRAWGGHALVVTGRNSARALPLLQELRPAGLKCTTFSVAGEPTIATVQAGVTLARQAGCDLVVAMGGGSAVDAGKAIAALVTNEGDPFRYLEVVGKGLPLEHPPAPFVAIPTTAGTGAEVTRNAVLASPEHRVKVSLRSPLMLPKVAVVDPDLTLELPPDITATTGLDALTQLIEPYVCSRANPLTDALCREGIRKAARSLRRVFTDGTDRAARTDMALASLCGGMALANAGLGAVHGFAAPIGGMFAAPHGAVCATLLAPVISANARALQACEPCHPALERYRDIARWLTGQESSHIEDAVEWIRDLCSFMGISSLASFGIREMDFPLICDKAAQASSMKANPIKLDRSALLEILQDAGSV